MRNIVVFKRNEEPKIANASKGQTHMELIDEDALLRCDSNRPDATFNVDVLPIEQFLIGNVGGRCLQWEFVKFPDVPEEDVAEYFKHVYEFKI